MSSTIATASFPALGTTAVVVVADDAQLARAHDAVAGVIAEVDRACSRFRDDSDLARLNARAGHDVVVSRWLLDALDVALRGARTTDGLVDPTVGSVMREIGYDRSFDELERNGPPLLVVVRPVPGWHHIRVDHDRGTVRIPKGVSIDLGATAKAWCADRAAAAAADATGVGVLVSLGGDVSCAGDAPSTGWAVRIADDHRADVDEPGGQTVELAHGGIATSGTSVRRWSRGGRAMHHIVDPRKGLPVEARWRTVTVAAGTCADANIASTAAVVLDDEAPRWLEARRLPSRLVDVDGHVTTVAGWPQP